MRAMPVSPSSTWPDARLVPRRASRRVVFIGLLALPLFLLAGAVLEPSSALHLVVPALLLAAPLVVAVWYEHTYRLWVSHEGVEVRALGLTGIKQTPMRFDEIGNKGISQVAQMVVENTTPRLQTEVLDALDRGERVSFGPYALAPTGVQWRSTVIPWSDIETFDVDDDGGKLTLKKNGAWLATANPRAEKVPNLDVLLAVVNEKRGV